MRVTAIYGFWAILLFSGCFVLVYWPRGGTLAHVYIELCAFFVAAVSLLVLRELGADLVESRQAPRVEEADLSGRVPSETPPRPAFREPIRIERDPSRSPVAKGRPSLEAPRFGTRGSKAHGLPWLLPARPVQPGVSADAAQLADLQVRAASVVGPGHRCEEPATPRQDAYRIARDARGDHLIVAVADGVSASGYSDRGATVAASTAVKMLRERLGETGDPGVLSAWDVFHRVAEEMRVDADRAGLKPSEIYTVLITAVIPVRKGRQPTRDVWIGWIGDVSAWSLNGDKWDLRAGDQKGGLDSNALGRALPRDPESAQEKLLQLPDGSVITFVSDGVGDALATLGEANRYLAEQWACPPPIGDFLGQVGFDAPRFLDDRSAVTVWLGESGEQRR